MMRVVFMGSDAIALPALDWLASSTGSGQAGERSAVGRVVAVFTQPDRPVGRGQKVQPNAIKQWALARGLPVHQPEKFSDADRETLASYAPDLSLVMAYGHILRDPVIATPRLGTLNLHASLLPKLRGASPIQTAVATGECETGVALMRIVAALDAGPVADVERVPIAPLDTALDVEAKMSAACVPLLARTLPALARGELVFVEQDHAAATFCRRLEKTDGALDFSRPAAELAARINGLTPWPGCAAELAGQNLLIKFGLAEQCHLLGDIAPESAAGTCHLLSDIAAGPGTVVGADADGVLIATGEGVLRVRRLQRPGGRMLAAGEFTRGLPLPPGSRFVSQPMAALVDTKPFPHRRK